MVLAGFLADVVLHLGSAVRVCLDLLFFLTVAGVLAWGAIVAWFRSGGFELTARLLESRSPALGSKLINVLQLQAQTEDLRLAPLTRDLARLAVERYVEELDGEDFVTLARTGRVQKEAKRTVIKVLGFAALFAIGFEITNTEILRYGDPFGDHPPYSFTRLEISEPSRDGTQVVYGQSLTISAMASGHRPGELFLTWHPAGDPAHGVTLPMFDKGERGFSQQIEGIKSDIIVFAHTKNHHSLSRQRRISVILTPKLEKAFVRMTPPAYTGLAPDEKPLQMKSLKALAGSRLEFRLQSNRPLKQGLIEVIKSPEQIQTAQMNPSGENEVTGLIEALDSARLRFSLIDLDGHASQETWELTLTVTHDLPPEVQITNPAGDSFVAMDFKIDAIIEANDDYGVKTVRIFQARNEKWADPQVIDYPKPPLHARESLVFDLAKMELVSGDTISFFAEAIDNAPEPHVARSRTVTLTVITPEEYNAFLRERMDMEDIQAKYTDLIKQLRELAQEQKKLGEQSDAVRQQLENAKDDSARAALQKKLDGLIAKQNELNQQLNKLADTMENFVREKPVYDIEAELQQTLQEQARNIRESTAANEDDSTQIAQRSSPPQGARQLDEKMLSDFKAASDAQLKQLGETAEETQKEIVEPLEDMSLMQEIMKDLNHFKELYEAQSQLAQQAKAYDRATPLSREDQLALKDLAGLQKEIGEQLDAVEQKLWEDGKAAMEKFPKAGQSAQDIAQHIGDARLQSYARNATDAMLAGQGDKGSQLSALLRDEMAKLFSECKGKEGSMSDELDQAMSLNRGLNTGNSFKQMMQCKKFGTGNKPGFGKGSGPAGTGSNGFAVKTGPNANVLGNEAAVSHDSTRPGAQGRNQARPAGAPPEVSGDKPEAARNLNPVNRESDAVQGESWIEQYSDVVERYFKAITK
ncbi:MAG: hypothetical protein JWL90_2662 [Chthoniobacteraceae bacterium]|nr:hypothetical protein [Chthoniobacteraceae bacterium]